MSEREILITKINSSYWWHVPPCDSDAYKKRGKFFASTFSQAEFYGRPHDEPERVNIRNPVYGFSEMEILEKLFTSEQIAKFGLNAMENGTSPNWYDKRIALDHKMYLRGHNPLSSNTQSNLVRTVFRFSSTSRLYFIEVFDLSQA